MTLGRFLPSALFIGALLVLVAAAGCGSTAELEEPRVLPATSTREPVATAVSPEETQSSPSPVPATPTTEAPATRGEGTRGIQLGTASAYVDGVGLKQEIMSTAAHVDLNDDDSDDYVTYNSVPPTSGDHWSTPVRCGFYVQPVPDEMIVHNMEHSNIVVSYNLRAESDFESLVDVLRELPDLWREHFTVARPYAEIDEGSVALSTWGVLDIMKGVDSARILRFYEHYVGTLGPEGAISCRGAQQGMSGG